MSAKHYDHLTRGRRHGYCPNCGRGDFEGNRCWNCNTLIPKSDPDPKPRCCFCRWPANENRFVYMGTAICPNCASGVVQVVMARRRQDT